MICGIQSVWGGVSTCQKSRVFNTDSQSFITFLADDNLQSITAINDINSSNLVVAYYDNITNAIAGTVTGRLALGRTAVNSYLSATGWASGEAIRIYNSLGANLQTAEIVYKSTPSIAVPCGVQETAYVSGNAKIYDGVFDSDLVTGWNEFNANQPLTVGALVFVDSFSGTPRMFSTRAGLSQKGFQFGINSVGRAFCGFASNIAPLRVNRVLSDNSLSLGYSFITFTFDGGGNASTGWTVGVNDVEVNSSVLNTLLIGDTVVNGTSTATTGNTNTGGSNYFDGLIRKLQIIDTDYSGTQIIENARLAGSFEGLIDDARFLFDPDFNQTSGNLTTRVNTPSYTITANGGAAYTKFIP